MSDIWADFPTNSLGLYGSTAQMTDGIYAGVSCGLANDPDPTIGAAGQVLYINGYGAYIRLIYPSSYGTVGIASRVYFPALPGAETSQGGRSVIHEFRDASSNVVGYTYIDTGGKISFVNGSSVTASPDYTSSGPVITANAWWHIESKLVCDTGGTGTIEIRVNGISKITETGLTTSANTIGEGFVRNWTVNGGSHLPGNYYSKDIVWWNGSGTHNNDFHGSVSVFWRPVASTDSIGGWTLSKGSDAIPLLSDAAPHNVLTQSGAISSDEIVRIDNTYYKFTSGSVDTGTPAGTSAHPWLVTLGSDDPGSMANLSKAINNDGAAGTDYSTALTAHPTVICYGLSQTALSVSPKDGGTTVMTFSETGVNLAWAAGNMFYGPDDVSYIAADSTPPAAAEFTLEALPEDITTVRSIIPVVRAAKVDGGDGNIQIGLTPDGTNYDTGPDTVITTAFTFWGNATYPFVSEENPATSSSWLPSDFTTGVRIKINRTV